MLGTDALGAERAALGRSQYATSRLICFALPAGVTLLAVVALLVTPGALGALPTRLSAGLDPWSRRWLAWAGACCVGAALIWRIRVTPLREDNRLRDLDAGEVGALAGSLVFVWSLIEAAGLAGAIVFLALGASPHALIGESSRAGSAPWRFARAASGSRRISWTGADCLGSAGRLYCR